MVILELRYPTNGELRSGHADNLFFLFPSRRFGQRAKPRCVPSGQPRAASGADAEDLPRFSPLLFHGPMPFDIFRLGFCGLVLAVAAQAQDLTWTELEVVGESASTAAPSQMKGRHRAEVPPEMKNLNEIGYATAEFVTTAKGQGVSRSSRASSPWLLAVLQESIKEVELIPSPGTSVPFLTQRCYLLFNPGSAALTATTRTPRVIKVCSAVLPEDLLAETNAQKRDKKTLPSGVWAEVWVDNKGTVTKAMVLDQQLPQSLRDSAAEAAKNWNFLPAQREGTAVPATLRIPILIEIPTVSKVSELNHPPRVIKKVSPDYPPSESRRGFVGNVMVQVVVGVDGRVRDAQVVQSNNLKFNSYALAAVKKWRFEPGLKNGQAVDSPMQISIAFNLLDAVGAEHYQVTARDNPKLPAELRNDFPPRVKNAVQGVFPFDRLMESARADVRENFVVRPTGRVQFFDSPDQKLSEFDYAARAMLDEYQFVPASKNGSPNPALLGMNVKFSLDSDTMAVSDAARHIIRELRKKEPKIFTGGQVDEKPKLIQAHSPIYPSNLLDDGPGGEALIEFFIDEKGQAQLPRIISASHPSFGYAAAQAVAQWRFEPLTHEGKRCIVRLQVPIKFQPLPPLSPTEK
jgi:TonB family protein